MRILFYTCNLTSNIYLTKKCHCIKKDVTIILHEKLVTSLCFLQNFHTARNNHCCNLAVWNILFSLICHNTARSNHCCNGEAVRRRDWRGVHVTIPLAVITVATAGSENPCPERLSKPDLANQMNFC